jgi:mannan endo-1,4-beta-mannosidase
MDAAVAKGFTVMRAWSHGVTPNYALQTGPGIYNEGIFRGLDYALDEAHKRNLKVRNATFGLPLLCCTNAA